MAKNTDREIVQELDREFGNLIDSLKDLASSVPVNLLYRNPPAISIGECILRSAAVVEQTCGGLTSNLWDDPFEWTLPETLSTPALITEYFEEVAQTRATFFTRLKDDGDLTKHIAVPVGATQTLVRVLLAALIRAAGYQERAAVILEMLSQASSREV